MEKRVAIVDKCPSNTNYDKYFGFEYDVFHLSSVKLTKLLKKDIDLDLSCVDGYEYVILVGSEACKIFTKVSVTDSSGHLVDGKFIPLMNPAMAIFKPEVKEAVESSVKRIYAILDGSYDINTNGEWELLDTSWKIHNYLKFVIDAKVPLIALDTETTALYPRDGHVLGISMSHKERQGVYMLSDEFDDLATEMLQKAIDGTEVVFHNAKFDMKMLSYHFGLKFDRLHTHDTLILHYLLDETQGSHGLKTLALKYTKYGDYDRALDDFKKAYCKAHGVKQEDFTYDLIPIEIISQYACIDTAVTLELFNKFHPIVARSEQLAPVYTGIMMPGLFCLTDMEEAGIPFSRERLAFASRYLDDELSAAWEELYKLPEVRDFERIRQDRFNPNSVVQLRSLLFDFIGLRPTGKKTATGQHSTDADVLTELSDKHPVVASILKIRKLGKIKSTYIDKIAVELDRDGNIRTGFNMTSTTSGRLSSSGKFNAQQIIRDDPIVKGCIQAPPGYKIVSQDLATAEMYYAAVLSGDDALMSVFKEGGDFHSSIAKMVFRLACPVSDVKKLFTDKRQAAKAISFGILYGSGPDKVADTVGYSVEEAREDIDTYFRQFPRLKQWLDERKKFIKQNGYIYSVLGRKRRLKNVFSPDKSVSSHEVRSGINFLIQSVASDINLMGCTDMWGWLKTSGLDARIIMMVHDSIVAVVKEEHVAAYCNQLRAFTQKDRGVSIPFCPIGVDQDVGDDYSFGHFLEVYGEKIQRYEDELPAVCN